MKTETIIAFTNDEIKKINILCDIASTAIGHCFVTASDPKPRNVTEQFNIKTICDTRDFISKLLNEIKNNQ